MPVKKQLKLKSLLLHIAIGLALAVALAFLAYLSYVLILQSSWKSDRLKLTAYFSDGYSKSCRLEQDGVWTSADDAVLDYYFNILTFPRSMAIGRGTVESSPEDILLYLPGTTVAFSPGKDGVSTHVQWEMDGKTVGYTLGGTMDYKHLQTYFNNRIAFAPSKAGA